MPNKRLEEAMKATRYTSQRVAAPSNHTGKAFEQPVVKPTEPKKPDDTPDATALPGKRIYQKPGRVRYTTPEEVADSAGDGSAPDGDGASQEANQGHRSRSSRSSLPTDPFPLEYKDGDPDKEFDCD